MPLILILSSLRFLFPPGTVLYSVLICEPVTCITDILLALYCFYAWRQINNQKINLITLKKWGTFFLFVGLGTLVGGIAHGISCNYPAARQVLWICMQLLSGGALYYALIAVFYSELTYKKSVKLLIIAARIQFTLFALAVLIFQNFVVVSINSSLGLLTLLIIIFPKNFRQVNYNLLVFTGILLSTGVVFIERAKLTCSQWLNQNDLAHVLMYICLFLIYKGVMLKQTEKKFFK
jgi:hypothetical protein